MIVPYKMENIIVKCYNISMSKQLAKTNMPTDDQIQTYAELVLSGDLQPEQCFKRAFGFVPSVEQLREVEANAKYRERIDSVLITLQAQLKANSIALAHEAVISVGKSLQHTGKLIEDLLQDPNMKISHYVALVNTQIKTFQAVKDELVKAELALNQQADDDKDMWDEIFNN